MNAPPCLSILVLTEDAGSASDAGREKFEIVRIVVQRMLQLVVAGVQTHRIEWRPANDRARLAMRGPMWKSTGGASHADQVELRRLIARTILEPRGYVLFHIDGDRPWSDRQTSENVAKFDQLVALPVTRIVRDELLRRGLAADALDGEVRRLLQRLIRVTPFYSIEAWLYQNLRVLRALCEARCGRHLALLDAWSADRAQIDEVTKPKESLCVRDKHNLSLARDQFPAEEALAAERSYAETVWALVGLDELQRALEATRETPPS